MKRRLAGLVVVGALLQGLLVGTAAAAGPAVIQARTTAAVTLVDAGGVSTPVESVTLGAGSWTVSSDLTAINFGPGDYVRCHLQADGATLHDVTVDGGATVYLVNRVAGISTTGTLKSSTSVSVTTECSHDGNAVSGGQFYLDPGATMTAVKGGPIRGPGMPGTGAPTVVESRSSGHTALNDGSYVDVTSVVLPAGTWAMTGNASAVNFADNDFAACSLFSGGGGATTSSFNQVSTGAADAIVSGLDVEGTVTEPANGGTVDLACISEFANDVTIDPGATLTATKVNKPSVTKAEIGTIPLPNAGGQAKVVLTEKVPAAAWRVRSTVLVGNHNANNSWGGGRDFLRCSLKAGGVAIDGGATVEMTPNTNIEQIVNVGSHTASTSWTLTLSCAHDQAHTGDGHWSTAIGGAVVAVNNGPIA